MRLAGPAKIAELLALTAFMDQIVVNCASVAIIPAAERMTDFVIVRLGTWAPDVRMVSIFECKKIKVISIFLIFMHEIIYQTYLNTIQSF